MTYNGIKSDIELYYVSFLPPVIYEIGQYNFSVKENLTSELSLHLLRTTYLLHYSKNYSEIDLSIISNFSHYKKKKTYILL